MALALTTPELRAQDTLVVKLFLRTTDFSFGNQDGYDVIKPKRDRMSHIMIPGHPQLPTWHPAYIIPYWKGIAYCEIVALDSVQIPGTYNIYPAQVVPIDGNPGWIPPDPAIYNSDSLYPGKLMLEPGSGVFDGARIATLNLYPIRYRPKSGRLFLYTSAQIKLVFKDAEPPINAKQRYAHVQEIYDRMLALLVENDADIGAWYRRPAIIDPNGGKDLIPFLSFVIITTEAQATDNSLLAYRDWMYQKGYPTSIQTIEWIMANVSGADPAEKLKNYIQICYQLGVSFFLLLGNVDGEDVDIPYRKLGPSAHVLDAYGWYLDPDMWPYFYLIPSDLYFSEVNLDWDTNDDGYYGAWNPYGYFPPDCPESDTITEGHIMPDVFVGRIVAKTTQDVNEIKNWVDKVLAYEKNPGNGVTRVLYSAQEKPFGGVYTFEWNLSVVQPCYPGYFSWDSTFSAWTTLSCINDTAAPIGWLNTYGHGKRNKWWDCDDASFYSASQHGTPNLAQLTNSGCYFISYQSNCAQTGYTDEYPDGVPEWVTDTTVGEGFVEAYPDRGAVANISNTRFGVGGAATYLQRDLLDGIFTQNLWLLGCAYTYAEQDPGTNRYQRYSSNLFGSPLTEVWTNVPVATRIRRITPNPIPPNQQSTVRVTVLYHSEGGVYTPLEGAMVTLYGCGAYGMGYTNSNGQAQITVTPTQSGTIILTATKHDYLPSQGNLIVSGKAALTSDDELPSEFFMSIASSNPVKGNLKLQYGIPLEDEGPVSLKIYDVSGRVVQTVFSEEKSAGYYDLSIPTSSFSAGTYFLRLETQNKAKTEKVILK